MERIGRFKEQYKVGNLHTISVKQADGKVTDIQFVKNEQCHKKESSFGAYVLRQIDWIFVRSCIDRW